MLGLVIGKTNLQH